MWIKTDVISDVHLQNEHIPRYFTWQIGLLTSSTGASFNVTRYSVSLPKDSPVTAENLTCFNLGGVGYDGVPFAQPMSVAHVGTLWFGLQVIAKLL